VFEASKAVKLEWVRRAFVVGAGIATLSQVSQEFLQPLMHNALSKQAAKNYSGVYQFCMFTICRHSFVSIN
jgi:hypothetical protein